MNKPKWYNFSVNGNEAELTVYGEVGYWPDDAATFLAALKRVPSDVKTIHLRIHSPGGSVIDGVAIYNALRRHKARIVAHVEGWAASMASVILMAADEIHCPKNCWLMIHSPAAAVAGNAAELRRTADVLDAMHEDILDAYSRHSSASRADIAAWVEAETWISGERSPDFGFDFHIEDEIKVAAAFDSALRAAPAAALAIFNTQPKEDDMNPKILTALGLAADAKDDDALAFIATLKTPADVQSAGEAIRTECNADILAKTDAAYADGKVAGLAQAQATTDATIAEITGKLSASEAELASVKAKHDKLLAGAGAPSSGSAQSTALSVFLAKVREVAEANPSMSPEDASVTARRLSPDLFKSMIAETNRK